MKIIWGALQDKPGPHPNRDGVGVAAYFLEDAILTTPYHQTRAWLGISSSPPNTLLCTAYSILVSFRLLWWLIIAGSVAFIDPQGLRPFCDTISDK